MYHKVVRFFTTIIFSLIPFFSLADQIETQISADTITVERGEVLFAEGNVLVTYGKNKIKAKALKFNQKTKKIKFTEIQDLQDGNAISLSATEAVLAVIYRRELLVPLICYSISQLRFKRAKYD